MATTDYDSVFPSGLYQLNLKAERRLDSPETVMAARDHNRQEVEIRRIQEVVGEQTGNPGTVFQRLSNIEAGSGVPAHPYVGAQHYGLGDGIPISSDVAGHSTVSGHVQDPSIHVQAANHLPFHDDPLDLNYQFVQWFLTEMELWDKLSAGGAPSITEVVKALWQNKYNIEAPMEPVFLPEGAATGATNYVLLTAQSDVTIWTGWDLDFADDDPPIGAFCNLSGQPYPLIGFQDYGSGSNMSGFVQLVSGQQVIAYTRAGSIPPAASDYVVCVLNNPINIGLRQPIPPASGLTPPPYSGDTPPGGWQPDYLDTDVFRMSYLDLGPDSILYLNQTKKIVKVESGGDEIFTPGSAQNLGLQAVSSGTYRGIALNDVGAQDWGIINFSLRPYEVALIYAGITNGAAPGVTSGLAAYVTKFAPANSGAMPWDRSDSWNVTGIAESVGPDEIKNVPMLQVYNPYPEPLPCQAVISNEDFDAFWLMYVVKRTLGYINN